MTKTATKPSRTLYTPADVQEVRHLLLKQQNGLDALTGLPIPDKQAVLDHCHQTQYVRGVLHRQSNAVLGKLENMYIRYLSWWYKGTLAEFLRKAADYLDRKQPKEYVHTGWLKRVKIDFNKLNAAGKDSVLKQLGSPAGKNEDERKKLFSKVLLTKEHNFDTIQSLILHTKGST